MNKEENEKLKEIANYLKRTYHGSVEPKENGVEMAAGTYMFDRSIYQKIFNELIREKSMVFACGPRQAGKTTFAKIISQSYNNTLYFNWDIPGHRVELLKNPNFLKK